MKSFFVVALAAYANAVCDDPDAGTICTDFSEVQDAVMTYAGDYTFQFIPVTGGEATNLRMIQFTGDETSTPLAGQGEKGIVLMLASYTQDCLDLLTKTSDSATDSIPKQLFDAGYDVFLGCSRGSKYSQPDTIDDTYWDTTCTSDKAADVKLMAAQAVLSTTDVCTGVSIIADGVGAAEALLAADGDTTIQQVIATTPCYVPDYLSEGKDSSSHRLLRGAEDARELNDSFEADRARELQDGVRPEGRELSHYYYDNYSYTYRSSYWDRTERYCSWNPSSCYNYCDWYPSYCTEFCYWFPEFCTPQQPAEVKAICDLRKAAADNDIGSLYGATYTADVTTLCAEVDADTCAALKAADGQGFKEVSLAQLEDMFQKAYSGDFTAKDATFCDSGYETDATAIDLTAITQPVTNIYLSGDDTCSEAANQAVTIPTTSSFRTFVDADLAHDTVIGANDNTDLVGQILAQLDVAALNPGCTTP